MIPQGAEVYGLRPNPLVACDHSEPPRRHAWYPLIVKSSVGHLREQGVAAMDYVLPSDSERLSEPKGALVDEPTQTRWIDRS